MSAATILIMAGGTGGHIMPGLAVAHEMKARGWQVLWLGHPERMEGRLVPAQGFELLSLHFSGLRGKGVAALLRLPVTLARACLQARRVLRAHRPDVVLGMGGYVAFPGGLMAALGRIPLVIHEQNAVAGTANRWLARLASRAMTGFPGVLPGATVTGNPVRGAFMTLAAPQERYARRDGRLRVLVIGGSLGAMVLNTVVPQALALLDEGQRPDIRHQGGEQHLDTLRAAYADAGVDAQCSAFIDDMPAAYGWADLVICRAGAMTVSEVAAVGVAALFVPLPHAIDDHQRANAAYLADRNAGWVQAQSGFSPEWLADWLRQLQRDELAQAAGRARQCARLEATAQIADACAQAVERRS